LNFRKKNKKVGEMFKQTNKKDNYLLQNKKKTENN